MLVKFILQSIDESWILKMSISDSIVEYSKYKADLPIMELIRWRARPSIEQVSQVKEVCLNVLKLSRQYNFIKLTSKIWADHEGLGLKVI